MSSMRDHGRLVVIGQGYVGLPLAMRAASVGWSVVGLDVDAARVRRLKIGDSYIEDVSSEQLVAASASGRYHATSDYAEAINFDVAVITVPTPLREGVPDLTYIEKSTQLLAAHVSEGCVVILESTTYPGTTQELVAPILEAVSGLMPGRDFSLGYSPERIDPGNPVWTLVNTPKVVSGVDAKSLEAVSAFYHSIIDTTVPVSSPREAELTKLLENTFRHVNIALVNELAMYAHDLGINIWEAIDAASSKPFGYLRFTPGPGVGGHCLPIDPSYLSWRVKRALGQSFRFVELANDVNERMPDYVVRRIVATLNSEQLAVNGSRILLLGLAYKKNTGDARESPAARIAELLIAMGGDVRVCDPHVVESPEVTACPLVKLVGAEVAAAELVVVLTDHDSFDLNVVRDNARRVLDCRRVDGLPSAELL